MTVIIPTLSGSIKSDTNQQTCVTFEEAINATGFGKFNVITMMFCGFLLVGMILETVGLSFIIPAGQCDLELTQTQKGWLAAIPFICIVITSHIWGYLTDTRGRKKILVFSMSVGAFFSILSSISPDLITFAALRFVAGLFIAAASAGGYTYLGEMNPLKHRDKMVTLGNASVGFGTAIVPLLAWGVLSLDFNLEMDFLPYGYRPWRLLIALFALPYAISAVLFIYFPESPKFLQAQGQTEEALEVLQNMYSKNSGKAPEDYPITSFICENQLIDHKKNSILKDIWIQTVPLFSGKYIWNTLILCFLQFGTFAITNGIYIWYPTIINKLLENSDTQVYDNENLCVIFNYDVHSSDNTTISTNKCVDVLNTSTFPVSIGLALIVSLNSVAIAFILNIFGKRNILIAIFFAMGTSSFIIHWLSNTVAAIVVISILQLCGTAIGINGAFAIEIFPTTIRAMSVCLTMMMGRVGSVFGTNLIGYLIETTCPVIFFTFTGLMYVCLVCCFVLPNNKQNDKKI